MSVEDELSGLASEYALWRALTEHPAWPKWKAVADSAVSTRANAVMGTRLATMEQALGQEYLKGEANGIALIMSLPQSEMERLEHEMKLLNDQPQGENDATGTGSDDTASSGNPSEPIDDGNNPFVDC